MAGLVRGDVTALIPEDVIPEIIKGALEGSTVFRMARRLRDMKSDEMEMPILSELPTGYWVSGDTGLKNTTRMAWEKKTIVARELAVIVPVPENVLMDTSYDLWGQIRPEIDAEFARKIDAAILVGDDAPSGFPTDILAGALAASQTVTLGAGADVYDDIMGVGGTISKVEEDGFAVTGHIATMSMRAKLRALRDANGGLIFNSNPQDATRYSLDGEPVFFPRNGAFTASDVYMISGDWQQLVYSIRQDMTFKVGTEAVIQDNSGNILLNTFQQDAVALRCVMRLGWQLPNPINRLNENDTTRYPFAALVP